MGFLLLHLADDEHGEDQIGYQIHQIASFQKRDLKVSPADPLYLQIRVMR